MKKLITAGGALMILLGGSAYAAERSCWTPARFTEFSEKGRGGSDVIYADHAACCEYRNVTLANRFDKPHHKGEAGVTIGYGYDEARPRPAECISDVSEGVRRSSAAPRWRRVC
jgi:hypothetical protein